MRTATTLTLTALLLSTGCETPVAGSGAYDGLISVPPVTHENEDASVTPIEQLGVIAACDVDAIEPIWEIDLGASLSALAWAPDGRVAVASAAGSVELLSIDGSDDVGFDTTITASESISSIAIDNGGATVIAGDGLGRATLWDAETGDITGSVAPGNHGVSAVALSAGGELAAAVSEVGEMVLWSPVTYAGHAINAELDTIGAVAFDGDAVVVVGSAWGRPALEIRDARDPHDTVAAWIAGDETAGAEHTELHAVAATRDAVVAVGGTFGHGVIAVVRDTGEERTITEAVVKDHGPTSVAVLPDGKHFVTVGTEGAMRVWNLATLEPVSAVDAPEAASISYDPFSGMMATAGTDGVLRGFSCAE